LEKGWGKPPEWLFYNEAGKPLNVSNLMNRIFVKCLEKAKLSHRRQHDLRHTYATLRIAKGDNILDVSRQLGHHSVKLTLDVYAHWLPGEKKSEVDELDSASAPIRTLYAPKPAIEQKKDSTN
jgi:integrase